MVNERVISEIYEILKDRRDNPTDSYTSLLMQDDNKTAEDKILEKIGEEVTELIIAAKNEENVVHESVDLIFNTLLLLVYKKIELKDVLEEFDRRRR